MTCFSLTCHPRETPEDTRLQRFKGFKPRTDDGKHLTSVNCLALSLKKKKKDLLSVAHENLIFSLKEVVIFTPWHSMYLSILVIEIQAEWAEAKQIGKGVNSLDAVVLMYFLLWLDGSLQPII